MKPVLLAGIALLCLHASSDALAHHSTANFEMAKHVTFKGTVKHCTFTNPHSLIEMDVTEKSGVVRHYKLASVPKVTMARTGWLADDLKVGDTVTVTSNPDRKDPTYVFLEKITFVNGKTWDRNNVF